MNEQKLQENIEGAGLKELKKKCVDKLSHLSFWFAREMFREEEKNRQFWKRAKEDEERAKANPEYSGKIMINVADNNTRVMKDCMKATVEAIDFIGKKDADVQTWQLAGILGMIEQINKEDSIPYDLPYAVKGILLQWDSENGAGLVMEAIED